MNLQICFMNDGSSDTDSIHSIHGVEPTPVYSPPGSPFFSSSSSSAASSTSCSPKKLQAVTRPQVLSLPPLRLDSAGNYSVANKKQTKVEVEDADFFARQARLQTEARMALAQAKEMAHMQMEVERQKLKQNPITEMMRDSLAKVGFFAMRLLFYTIFLDPIFKIFKLKFFTKQEIIIFFVFLDRREPRRRSPPLDSQSPDRPKHSSAPGTGKRPSRQDSHTQRGPRGGSATSRRSPHGAGFDAS